MKFLSPLFLLFFAVILFSCQSGVRAPEKEDFSKLEGLVSEIELQMGSLRAELEQITDYNESLLQKRDSILGTPFLPNTRWRAPFRPIYPGRILP